MALQLLSLRFLLVLLSLLPAQGLEEPDPKVQGVPVETEMCQRPRWDSRLRLVPDQENYRKNEEVMLSCPDGFQPAFTHVKCAREVQSISHGKPVYREVWNGRDSRGRWIRIRSSVECIEVFQVVPGTLEISSTSIKLNWTCRLPDTCQHMRATCRLAGPSSPPCEAEEVEGEEMLHGQEGTFICPPLQPFTDYSVTISLPPSTILFEWLVRTEETVPDKPEKLWLDPNTGSLRWKALPSCKGEIIGYQLNITARSARDGGLLQIERLRLSRSVTEHPLPGHGLGHSYTATVQGVTAIGAGAASLWEFQPDGLDTPHPAGISCRSVRDVSPSQGTAVLPLQPIARPPAEGAPADRGRHAQWHAGGRRLLGGAAAPQRQPAARHLRGRRAQPHRPHGLRAGCRDPRAGLPQRCPPPGMGLHGPSPPHPALTGGREVHLHLLQLLSCCRAASGPLAWDCDWGGCAVGSPPCICRDPVVCAFQEKEVFAQQSQGRQLKR
ncbi:uncharacterized protein LOC121081311 isoform X1 [Falco naumanni]|uniref:uncharacterized protein LOC121081311 isoform X1 n=1 Tax=Falco naumanni TaxID=148594 RepID=UPI001ADDE79A|nr:uncharacterized protein LOC121081311 isoform X1 [Falco naumanni]